MNAKQKLQRIIKEEIRRQKRNLNEHESNVPGIQNTYNRIKNVSAKVTYKDGGDFDIYEVILTFKGEVNMLDLMAAIEYGYSDNVRCEISNNKLKLYLEDDKYTRVIKKN